MLKFSTESFLAHFFKKDEVVEVNADELQRLIRKSREKDTIVKRLKSKIEALEFAISAKDARIEILKAETNSVYRLDLSA